MSLPIAKSSALVLALGLIAGCAHKPDAYVTGNSFTTGPVFHSPFPFARGTAFRVRQGAFGKATHSEPGAEYAWDLEVPLSTPVLAVASGKVLRLQIPESVRGECEERFASDAWSILVENDDGSVTQYTHVDPKVKVDQRVARGEVIGATTWKGYICRPHLHFMVYQSRNHLYESRERRTIPVRFVELRDGILRERLYQVGNEELQ